MSFNKSFVFILLILVVVGVSGLSFFPKKSIKINSTNCKEILFNLNEVMRCKDVVTNINLWQSPWTEEIDANHFFEEISNHQQISSIAIFANPIQKIPGNIGKLKNLRTLTFMNNGTESLPKEIGQLQKLITLQMGGEYGGNKVTSLPKEIGLCTSLKELILPFNNIQELPIELKNCKNLKTIDLYANPGIDKQKLEKFRQMLPNVNIQSHLDDNPQDNKEETQKIIETNEAVYYVTGQVSYNCEPLVGASIVLDGTSLGTIANIDGVYELYIPKNKKHNKYLRFSHVKFNDRKIPLKNLKNYNTINAALEIKYDFLKTSILCKSIQKKFQGDKLQPNLNIKGQVLTNNDCIGLSNAEIIAGQDKALTDKNGNFNLKISSFNTKNGIRVTFKHPEHQEKIIRVENYNLFQDLNITLEQLEKPKNDIKPKTFQQKDEIFLIVERSAQPKNYGIRGFYSEIKNTITPPSDLNTEGIVLAQFRVNPRGQIDDIQIIKSLNTYCDKQVLDALKQAKDWHPAKQRGKSVDKYFILQVSFMKED